MKNIIPNKLLIIRKTVKGILNTFKIFFLL